VESIYIPLVLTLTLFILFQFDLVVAHIIFTAILFILYRIPVKSALSGYNMNTILFFGSWIALAEGIMDFIFNETFDGGVSGALILGIHRIGKIIEEKAKSGLTYSFESVETIKLFEVKNQKMDG